MRLLGLHLLGLLAATAVFTFGILRLDEARTPGYEPPAGMPALEEDARQVTPNTTRVGSDDPVVTAVAVSQLIYPATEEENTPGAVILVNRNEPAEAFLAASRVQHFPVNAPLLYVDGDRLLDLSRDELMRLRPEGVMADGNVQVYLVGTIGDEVERRVRELGFRTRRLRAETPVELAVALDDWSSTVHADHRNNVVIANLDRLGPAIPSAFWNAHMGDGAAFVTDWGVPEPTVGLLKRRANGPWIYLFGDESVVSPQTARELARYGHVTRVPGRTPAEVSARFAAFHDVGRNWGAWIFAGARSFGWDINEAGHNAIFARLDGPGGWQNVLPAATMSHMGKHAPVLLLDGGRIAPAVASWLRAAKPYPTAPGQQLLNHGLIIGGEETIPWEVQAELDLRLDAFRGTAREEREEDR